MRKLFIYTFAVFLTFAFAACSSEGGEGGNGSDPGNETIGPESWVSLALNQATASDYAAVSRALDIPNTDNGTTEERAIKSLRAVFFNVAGKVTKDVDLGVGSGTNGGVPGTSRGEAFKIPSTSTGMLIIANAPAKFPTSFATGVDYSVVVNAARSIDNASNETLADLTSAANGYMMTNARGDLEPVRLYAAKDQAESNPVKLNIDRVVAKVQVNATQASDIDGVTIGTPTWALNLTNKLYFPVSKRTKTYLETTARGCISPMDIYDPKLGSYRIDPNYDNNTGMYAPPYTTFANNYFYYTEATNASISWKAVGAASSDYCLENTQQEIENVHAYTTHALIRATYTPSKFYLPTDTNNNPTGTNDAGNNGDWIMIGDGTANTFYTYESVVAWIELELTNKFTHIERGNTTDFPTYITDAYNAFVAEVSGSAVDVSYTQQGTNQAPNYTAVTSAVATAKAAFEAKKPSIVALTAGKVVGNLNYYKGGLSYWQVMIKHDDSGDATVINKLGEFGVVRNSFYEINVSKFNRPGFPIVPDPDPEKKNEDNEGWLTVQINVNPWTKYTQEEIL